MGKMRWAGVTLVWMALLLAATPAHAQESNPPPYVPWVELLPPAGSTADVQPGPVRGCRKPTIKCIVLTERRLKRVRDSFGCDHRAIFADTYMLLTRELKRTVQRRPRFFDDNKWLFYETAEFVNFYVDTVKAYRKGKPVPEAWKIAMDTAASGDQNAAQDMLLGINAHVQRDMPYVIASIGLRMPDGTSRKPDHDKPNRVLAAAYEPIVRDIERRYDPVISLTNASWQPIDDVAGLEAVKGWREGVWRNAERLLAAKTDADRQFVAQSIEQNAATWARTIAATPGPPGYRDQRDAYCAERLSR